MLLPVALEYECKYNYEHDRPVANCKGLSLTSVPQNLSVKIVGLDLSQNNIHEIVNDSFAKYRNLVTLNLNENEIKEIQHNGFSGLGNLKELYISENNVSISSEHGVNILKDIKGIEILDISRNSIWVNNNYDTAPYIYPDKEFQYLTQLRSIYIDLHPIPVFGTGFRHLNLTAVYFRRCFIKQLKNSTFENLPKTIIEIGLTNCDRVDLSQIETGFFSSFPYLTSLDMSRTKISLVKGLELLYPFRYKNMTKINLSHMKTPKSNSISVFYAITIDSNMMRYLKTICVSQLYLHDNNIVDFVANSLFSFEKPHCIEHINVAGNRFGFSHIEPIDEIWKLYASFTKIKTFDFSYIPFTFINDKLIDNSQGGKNNTLAYHDKEDDDPKLCESLRNKNFTILLPKSVEYIRISHIMGAAAVPNLILKDGENLRKVDMSYFQFRCFPIFLLDNTDHLEYLDISGIPCKQYYDRNEFQLLRNVKTLIMKDVFLYQAMMRGKNILKFAPKVENLDLSNNGMRMISFDYFKNLQHLVNLKLSENNFRQIPGGVTQLPELKSLNIIFNRLYTIPNKLTTWFDQQQRKHGEFNLSININELYCSCENRDFVLWLGTTKVSLDKNGNYSCRLRNGTLVATSIILEQFHDLFSHCDAITWLRIGIILIISLFVIFIPVTVIFNFRWRITIFVYRTFRKFIENSMNLTYTYDVYVSYGYNGYPWVTEVLLTTLEKKWNLKICLEDRDFASQAGRSNYDLIANAINNSRHIIFFITSDFMTKSFAGYEIDQAKTAKMAHTLQQIIVITHDVNVDDIPTELRFIWSDVSLLNWPSEEKEREAVLDNLKTRVFLNL
jgi:Leucine-rich repeat (LRR) protein